MVILFGSVWWNSGVMLCNRWVEVCVCVCCSVVCFSIDIVYGGSNVVFVLRNRLCDSFVIGIGSWMLVSIVSILCECVLKCNCGSFCMKYVVIFVFEVGIVVVFNVLVMWWYLL